jgi:hypothetical protein
MLESINNRSKQNNIKIYIEMLVIESTLLTTTVPRARCVIMKPASVCLMLRVTYRLVVRS